MSNQYPQATTHQGGTNSYLLFSLLRPMNSKRNELRFSFAFFQKNYIPDGQVNEMLARLVEGLSDLLEARSNGLSSTVCDEL